MTLWRTLRNTIRRKPKPGTPNVGGRTSSDDATGSLLDATRSYFSDLTGLAALYPFELLELIDTQFMLEPYQARYLTTTLALGNTGHKLEIVADSEAQATAAIDAANDWAARCFPWAGGADGAINGLFCQMARTGALCAEAVPFDDLSDLKRLYLVPARSIRFRRKPDGDLELCQLQESKLVALNPVQTIWHIATAWDGSPYPIPPALAALRAAIKLAKFDDSLDGWLSKLSALGAFIGSVEPPPQGMGESQETYDARADSLLTRIAKSVSDNLNKGFVLSFDNTQFKFHNTTAGAAGAKDLLQMVLQSLFAGLERDPIFFGWNWNTTETFAKVVFEELLGGILNMQRGVKRAMEHFLRLVLALRGMGDVGISLVFNPNRSLDAFMQSEARHMEAQIDLDAFREGAIDRDELRKRLGYEEDAAKAGKYIATRNLRTLRYELQPYKQASWPVPIGNAPPGPQITVQNSARDARRAAREYLFEVQSKLSDSAKLGVQAVYEWARVRDIPEEDMFVSQAMRLFLSGAEETLDTAALERIGKTHIKTIWDWAKYEDDTVFGPEWDRRSRGTSVVMGVPDETAISYMSRVDRLYVSKYVSGDDRTSEQISNFLRQQYIDRGLGRGKSPKELAAFREQFGDLVEGIGEHRARVIIDTGVSRAQNWGEAFALHAEQITKFRVAGPWDRLTCGWCKAMRGHEFEVRTEVERIANIISSGSEEISKFHDFITTRFGGATGLATLQTLPAAEIQASGMVVAPLHPLCRHRMVAVIESTGNVRIYWIEEPPVLVSDYRLAA